jgi:sulfonate transport system substrate-binding protein
MSRLSRRSFAALAGGALLAGGTSARAADLAGVTLRVGDQTGAVRAKLEAAKVLDALPYRIEWSVYAAAVNLHESLKADAIDIGSAADSPTVSAIAGGSPIEAVAAWSNGGRGTSILVPKDSAIQTLADLKGRTISPTTRGSVAHYLLLGALKQAGLTARDVKIAFLTPVDASAAFQAGSIDAWATWGVYRARTEGVLGARRLLDGTGINSGLGVLSATRKALADPLKTAAIADYADRVQRGYDWSEANRDPWIDFYAAFAKQDRAIIEKLYDEEAAFRRVPADDALVAQLQQTYDNWVEAGVLSGQRDMAPFVYRGLKIG